MYLETVIHFCKLKVKTKNEEGGVLLAVCFFGVLELVRDLIKLLEE